jgi:hypothetical protein
VPFVTLDGTDVEEAVRLAIQRHIKYGPRPGAYGPTGLLQQVTGVLGEQAVSHWLDAADVVQIDPAFKHLGRESEADLYANGWAVEVKTFGEGRWASMLSPVISTRQAMKIMHGSHIIVWCSTEPLDAALTYEDSGLPSEVAEEGWQVHVRGWTRTAHLTTDARACWDRGRPQLRLSPGALLPGSGLASRLAVHPDATPVVYLHTGECGHLALDDLCWTCAERPHGWVSVAYPAEDGYFHAPRGRCAEDGLVRLGYGGSPIGDLVFDKSPCPDCMLT